MLLRKKYYDFIQNLTLFLPTSKTKKQFGITLDKYPVTPYLDTRESFIRWVHFIHNQINKSLGKPEIALSDSLNEYYHSYKPKRVIQLEKIKQKSRFLYGGLIVTVIGSIILLSNK